MSKQNDKDNKISNSSTGTVDWSVYLQQGVIIDLQIKRYRGTTTIGFPELGINPDTSTEFSNFLNDYLKPGQKRLIPPEIESSLKSIETQARNNLKECSYDCSAFDSTGKFVPATAYQAFKEQNKEFERRFWDIRDEFANSYDDIIERVRKDYRLLAINLYKQSHPDADKVPTRFINSFVNGIIEQIPPREEIVASFEYNTYLRRIPPYLLNVIKKKNDIDEKAMKIAATRRAQKSASNGEVTASKENVQGQEASSVVSFSQDPNLNQEIEADLMDSIEAQSNAVFSGFIHEIRTKIRRTAYEGAVQIISSIDKNDGKLVGRASIKAHNLVSELTRMDYGDDELKTMVSALNDTLSEEEGQKRDVDQIRTAAVKMRDWAKKSLAEINRSYSPAKKQAPKVKTAQQQQSPTMKRKAVSSANTANSTKKTAKTNTTVQISVPKNTGGRRAPKKH